MIANGWITSMKALLQGITVQARRAYKKSATGAEWEIFNKVAVIKGGSAIWRRISKTFLKDAGAMYEQLGLYSYRDMARAAIIEASGR